MISALGEKHIAGRHRRLRQVKIRRKRSRIQEPVYRARPLMSLGIH